MIFLTDTIPQFCPSCGTKLTHGQSARNEFGHKVSYACRDAACGAIYQYVATPTLIETARASGGDLAQFAEYVPPSQR